MAEIQISYPDGKKSKCPTGTRIEDLTGGFGPLPCPLAAVKSNKKILPLWARIEYNACLEPVFLNSREGSAIYRRSLAFLLAAAALEIFPQRNLYIGHSLGHSYYYTFTEGKAPDEHEIKLLAEKMTELVKEDIPITYGYMAYAEALEHFKNNRQNDTALLLAEHSESKVRVNTCGDFIDLYVAPLVPRTGLLSIFELMPYQD